MRITIETDDKKKQVFQHVTDAYLAVRTQEPMMKKKQLALLQETRSYSWGQNTRELVKEHSQSLVELQDFLKGLRSGNGSN